MIIISKFWTTLFSFGKANAITIFPFIFLKYAFFKDKESLVHHERIHLRQAIELGVIIFYLWYLIEFIIHFVCLRNFDRAYMRISFEREAYDRENDINYLTKREIWAFWRYL